MTVSQSTSEGALPDDLAGPGFVSRLFASGGTAFLLIGILSALFGVALPVWSSASSRPWAASAPCSRPQSARTTSEPQAMRQIKGKPL